MVSLNFPYARGNINDLRLEIVKAFAEGSVVQKSAYRLQPNYNRYSYSKATNYVCGMQ